MRVNLNEHIQFGLRRQPWDRRASNVVDSNQFSVECRGYEWLVCQEAGGPCGIVGVILLVSAMSVPWR